jgi:hypothetical protein
VLEEISWCVEDINPLLPRFRWNMRVIVKDARVFDFAMSRMVD